MTDDPLSRYRDELALALGLATGALYRLSAECGSAMAGEPYRLAADLLRANWQGMLDGAMEAAARPRLRTVYGKGSARVEGVEIGQEASLANPHP